VKGKIATLRIFRLFDNKDGFRLHTEELQEVEAKQATYASNRCSKGLRSSSRSTSSARSPS